MRSVRGILAAVVGTTMVVPGCGEDPDPVSDARTLAKTVRDGPMTEPMPQTNHIRPTSRGG